jgi:hypothetical protein
MQREMKSDNSVIEARDAWLPASFVWKWLQTVGSKRCKGNVYVTFLQTKQLERCTRVCSVLALSN